MKKADYPNHTFFLDKKELLEGFWLSLKNILSINNMSIQQSCQIQGPKCNQCITKDKIIEKYLQLITLLRIKHQKLEDSKAKDSHSSCKTFEHSDVSQIHKAHVFVALAEKLCSRRLIQTFSHLKNQLRILSLPLMVNSQCSNHNQPKPTKNIQVEEPLEGAFMSKVSSYLSEKTKTGDTIFSRTSTFLQNEFKSNHSQKFLTRKIFEISLEKQALAKKVETLKQDLQQANRRQQKEITKKRQSLEGLNEELMEKYQIIEELKNTIKILENKLGCKQRFMIHHQLLEEDSDSLKRVIFKLQNLNDKLNFDIQKLKSQKSQSQSVNKELKYQTEQLNNQILQLQEQVFELQNNKMQVQIYKKQMELVSQKFTNKMQKIKKIERKFSQFSKLTSQDCLSNNVLDQLCHFRSERKVHILQSQNYIHKSQTIRQIQTQNKLESIFTFLFHIEDQKYILQSPELFDFEEKQLLQTHKQKYINNLKISYDTPISPTSNRQISLQNSFMFDNTLMEALQQKPKEECISAKVTLKLLQLELERGRHIQKISELKQKYLHMRSVILTFLRTLQLRSFKREIEGILSVLCDFFQYSEQQRHSIFQAKSKKLFGLL